MSIHVPLEIIFKLLPQFGMAILSKFIPALYYITLLSFSWHSYPERRTIKYKSEPGTSALKTQEESTIPIPRVIT